MREWYGRGYGGRHGMEGGRKAPVIIGSIVVVPLRILVGPILSIGRRQNPPFPPPPPTKYISSLKHTRQLHSCLNGGWSQHHWLLNNFHGKSGCTKTITTGTPISTYFCPFPLISAHFHLFLPISTSFHLVTCKQIYIYI